MKVYVVLESSDFGVQNSLSPLAQRAYEGALNRLLERSLIETNPHEQNALTGFETFDAWFSRKYPNRTPY